MKMLPKPSLTKLSPLQKFILVFLSDERILKPLLVANSLSRALARLEARGLLIRTGTCWDLSVTPGASGLEAAKEAWNAGKNLYAGLGLKGPEPNEKIPKQRAGVQVELHF
jgi:hypothetical protein